MHWLCKLKGHDFVYEPPIVYCQRCGEFRHNPTTKPAGIKNTDAEIRDGVWSDSNKAPGANIDAKISEAGVDPAIVKRQAGVQGVSLFLGGTQPRQILTETVGGGSVSFNVNGANVSAGTTTGDTAEIHSISRTWAGNVDLIRTVVLYVCDWAPPYTDDVEIGSCYHVVNADNGGYLDLTTEEYHAGASTAAATTPAADSYSVLIVEQDFVDGETRFEQRGAVNETATIAAVDEGTFGICTMESNGGGGLIRIAFLKQEIFGSK